MKRTIDCRNAPLSVRAAKTMVKERLRLEPTKTLRYAIVWQRNVLTIKTTQKARKAFMETASRQAKRNMMNANNGSQELSGQVVIVTGAATNTGSTIARTLAGAGAAVVVNYRSSKAAALETVRGIESSGGRAIAVQADVCNQADVKRLVEETVTAFGPPSVLVNNANVRSFRPLMEITLELWRETLGPTLEGTLFCVQACVPHMRKLGGGAIINIGGGSGHTGVPKRTHVAAAKAGLAGMTGALAAELAPDNIAVNNIVPGRIETPRPDGAGSMPGLHTSPMGRSCRQQEIADLVRFLAGSGCRYMSGQMLHVNGARYVTIA